MTIKYKYINDTDLNRDRVKQNNQFAIIGEFKYLTIDSDVSLFFNKKWSAKTINNIDHIINNVPINKIMIIDIFN